MSIHRRATAPVILTAMVGALAAALDAQRFRGGVDIVRVDALVTDRGVPVRGLTAPDFEVRDDDVLQDVDIVRSDDAPINAILALDLSESVAGERLTHLRQAGHALIKALEPADQTALIGFSHMVVSGSPLTRDFDGVRRMLDLTLATGNTSVADACFTGLLLAESDLNRSMVLVFSDGVDTASWLTPDAVLDIAKRSDVVVYSISVSTNSAVPKPTFLRDVATATGGSVFEVQSTKDLSQEFLRVLEEFRRRYLLSFTPRGVSKDGFHRLTVKVRGRNYKVQARPGYLAR